MNGRPSAPTIGWISFGLLTAALGGMGVPRVAWLATLLVALLLAVVATVDAVRSRPRPVPELCAESDEIDSPEEHLSLDGTVRLYLRYLRCDAGASDRTVEDYTQVLRRLTACFPDHLLIAFEPSAGTEALREFIDALWGERSSGTRGKITSVLRSFFLWCYEEELLTGNPAAKLRLPNRIVVERETQDPGVVRRVIESQPSLRDRVAIQLMARFGLWKNELRLLKYGDIDMLNSRIRIRRRGGRIAHVSTTHLGFIADLKRLIDELDPEPGAFLMKPTRGAGLTYEPSSMHRWWKDCLKRAKTQDFSMDELRNSLAEEEETPTYLEE